MELAGWQETDKEGNRVDKMQKSAGFGLDPGSFAVLGAAMFLYDLDFKFMY